MKPLSRFHCPACGFAVFNRRVATCESCSAALPSEFLFTREDLSLIESEHERNDEVRKSLAREAAALEEARIKRRGEGG